MARFRVEATGYRELEVKLNRLTNSVPEHLQKQVLHDAAKIVADEARRLVPIDSGNLRDSITVSETAFGGAFKMNMALESAGLKVFIGPSTGGSPDGFYGHMVEFGTVHMTAQPFMRPAFDHTRAEVQKRLGDDLRAAVIAAAKR